jgi:DNA polymerase-3 subunit epsilon
LTAAVTAAAAGSQPHRALWDTTGAALLLPALLRRLFTAGPTLRQLTAVGEVPTTPPRPDAAATEPQPALFD